MNPSTPRRVLQHYSTDYDDDATPRPHRNAKPGISNTLMFDSDEMVEVFSSRSAEDISAPRAGQTSKGALKRSSSFAGQRTQSTKKIRPPPSIAPPPSFTETTKLEIQRRSYPWCWFCQTNNIAPHMAHVLAAKDDDYRRVYTPQGLVRISKLNHVDNGIPLCPNCHTQFDKASPGLVILPVDLEWFLAWERQDFKRRISAIRSRARYREKARSSSDRFVFDTTLAVPPRRVPDANDYRAHLVSQGHWDQYLYTLKHDNDEDVEGDIEDDDNDDKGREVARDGQNDQEEDDLIEDLEVEKGGLYQGYMRYDWFTPVGFPQMRGGKLGEPKTWHGSPTAMILHAARSLGQPQSGNWLDADTRSCLWRLVEAWRREPSENDVEEDYSDDESSPQRDDTVSASESDSLGSASSSASSSGYLSHEDDTFETSQLNTRSQTRVSTGGMENLAYTRGLVGKKAGFDTHEIVEQMENIENDENICWKFGPDVTVEEIVRFQSDVKKEYESIILSRA